MRWNLKYAIRSYVSHSMWLVPFFALLLYTVFQRAMYALGAWLLRTGWLDEKTRFSAWPCRARGPCSRR